MVRPAPVHRRHRGNIALAGAFMLLPMALLAGVGIDFGRAWAARDRLAQAVDAAALAGAAAADNAAISAEAQQLFTANLLGPGDLVVDGFSAGVAADGDSVTASASGHIRTTFLALAGAEWQRLPVAARATAKRTTRALELALVMDVSGGNAKGHFRQMQDAARAMVDSLFSHHAQPASLHVALVPFAGAVNLGADKAGWLAGGGNATAAFAPFRWRGCVEARGAGEDLTDAPPAMLPFAPFLYPSTRPQTAAGTWGNQGRRAVYGDNDWGRTPVLNSNEVPDADDTDSHDPAAMVAGADRKGPNIGCGQPVLGLSADKIGITRAIGQLQMLDRGGALPNLGLQAGWFAISPRWRGLWGKSAWGTSTPAHLPVAQAPRRFTKVIVLAGRNDTQWFDYRRPPGPDYTAYGRSSEGRLGTSTTAQAVARVNERMLALCSNIKAQGVVIYTIALQASASTDALYRQCATSPAHHFSTNPGASLDRAFQDIASQLSNVQLQS